MQVREADQKLVLKKSKRARRVLKKPVWRGGARNDPLDFRLAKKENHSRNSIALSATEGSDKTRKTK